MICNNPEVFEALIRAAATRHEVLRVRAGEGGEDDDPMELYASPSQGDPSAGGSASAAAAAAGKGAQGKGRRGRKAAAAAAGAKQQKTEQVSAVSADLCQEMHQLMCKQRRELSLTQLGEGTREEQAKAAAELWSRPKQAFISALLRRVTPPCTPAGDKPSHCGSRWSLLDRPFRALTLLPRLGVHLWSLATSTTGRVVWCRVVSCRVVSRRVVCSPCDHWLGDHRSACMGRAVGWYWSWAGRTGQEWHTYLQWDHCWRSEQGVSCCLWCLTPRTCLRSLCQPTHSCSTASLQSATHVARSGQLVSPCSHITGGFIMCSGQLASPCSCITGRSIM